MAYLVNGSLPTSTVKRYSVHEHPFVRRLPDLKTNVDNYVQEIKLSYFDLEGSMLYTMENAKRFNDLKY